MTAVFSQLRRPGVLGALVAYGVAAAGFLQLADIVVHALDLPSWSLRAYAGQASDEEVIAAERSMGDADDAPERLAQADYYLGILHATGLKPDLARARADSRARWGQDADVTESDLAGEELRKLPR